MSKKQIVITTERSTYVLNFKVSWFSTKIISVSFGERGIPIDKLLPMDPRQYEVVGCYHGRLKEGEYPLLDLKSIKKEASWSFAKGCRVAMVKRNEKIVDISPKIISVEEKEI